MCVSTFIRMLFIRESSSKSVITFKFSTVDMNFNFITLLPGIWERGFEIYSDLLPRLQALVRRYIAQREDDFTGCNEVACERGYLKLLYSSIKQHPPHLIGFSLRPMTNIAFIHATP